MVKQIIRNGVKNGKSLLFRKQKTILSGAFVIGFMLFISALLGLVKKRLYASIITPGLELDVFFAAFRLPDFVFQLLITGSLNAAFIPIFSLYISKEDKQKTWGFVSLILNLVLIIFITLSMVMFIFAGFFGRLVGPGFNPEQLELLVRLMRILLIAPILLGLSSFTAGVLQSFKRFLLPYFSPVVYNLGAILGIVFLYPAFGMEGAAWGVVIGAIAHFLIQLPALRHLGFKYSLTLKVKDVYLKQMLKLSLPRTIGAGIEQIKTLIFTNLASFLPVGSLSFFDLGQSITNLPISILGISIAQASLPQFASLHAKGDWPTLRKTFASSFNQILFLILPISVILVVLKIPVVRLIYGAGKFSWEDTVLTAWVVALFSISIFAQALNALMVRLFYALHETKLPVLMGLLGMCASLIVAIGSLNNYIPSLKIGGRILIPTNQIHGLVLGISMGSLVEFVFLFGFLTRKKLIETRFFINTPLKIIFSCLVLGLVIYVPVQILDEVFIDTTRVINLVILVWLVVSFGLTTYLVLAWILGIEQLRIVFKVLLKLKNFRKNLKNLVKSPQIVSTTMLEDGTEK